MLDASFNWDAVEVGAPSESAPEEPMGTKDKFWTEIDGSRWLFKFAREARGEVRNEDWAEWIVWNLARILDVPAAEVRPAECMGRRGIVSRSVLALDESLVHGNELLHDFDSEYQLDVKRENPDYTVEGIESALRRVGPPSGYDNLQDFTGFDVMASYLLLDALVAGRDRHHENWAAIERAGNRSLSPSFDHGNALGFQEPDDRAAEIASDQTRMLSWLERGRSHHFAGKPTLLTIAAAALHASSDVGAAYWRERLDVLSLEDVDELVDRVPEEFMSQGSRSFVVSMLTINRRRVLDGIE